MLLIETDGSEGTWFPLTFTLPPDLYVRYHEYLAKTILHANCRVQEG